MTKRLPRRTFLVSRFEQTGVPRAVKFAKIFSRWARVTILRYVDHRVAGIVAVSLRRVDGDSVNLTVADNGAPLMMNGQRSSDGFGLNLVARFADQLAGALKVEAEPKRFSIVFPAHAAQH